MRVYVEAVDDAGVTWSSATLAATSPFNKTDQDNGIDREEFFTTLEPPPIDLPKNTADIPSLPLHSSFNVTATNYLNSKPLEAGKLPTIISEHFNWQVNLLIEDMTAVIKPAKLDRQVNAIRKDMREMMERQREELRETKVALSLVTDGTLLNERDGKKGANQLIMFLRELSRKGNSEQTFTN